MRPAWGSFGRRASGRRSGTPGPRPPPSRGWYAAGRASRCSAAGWPRAAPGRGCGSSPPSRPARARCCFSPPPPGSATPPCPPCSPFCAGPGRRIRYNKFLFAKLIVPYHSDQYSYKCLEWELCLTTKRQTVLTQTRKW